jgi:hypothetical protein
MRKLRICACVALLLQVGVAEVAELPVAEVAKLRMYSSFWQNLHHFLYVSAWAKRSVSSGLAYWRCRCRQAPVSR